MSLKLVAARLDAVGVRSHDSVDAIRIRTQRLRA